MNTKNTKRLLQKGEKLIKQHNLYDLRISTAISIIETADKKDFFQMFFNGVTVGFLQGYKAAQAEMKKKLQQ